MSVFASASLAFFLGLQVGFAVAAVACAIAAWTYGRRLRRRREPEVRVTQSVTGIDAAMAADGLLAVLDDLGLDAATRASARKSLAAVREKAAS